jgi:flavodoxin
MIICATVSGTTARVAERLARRLGETQVADLKTADPAHMQIAGPYLVLLCPTYGDQELEPGFERFLMQWDWHSHRGLRFAFGELGIYTGYEEFGHGLIPMVYSILRSNGLRELVPPLSLDSMPLTDWVKLDAWADRIRHNLSLLHE